jgi:hypothetical protein
MSTSPEAALAKLSAYVQREGFKGWDVFDGLNSRFFRNSPFYRSRLCRLAWIQLFKRSPINLRSLAAVPKGYNAKGLALFASGLLRLGETALARDLLRRLKELRCSGAVDACWGYNFDWQARAFFVPEGKPNMIVTVFAANALLDDFDQSGDEENLALAAAACDFILKNLIVHEDRSTLCFGYIPGEGARVHNANMLGAALLGRVYARLRRPEYLAKSRKAMRYSLAALDENHAWPYGERNHHRFIDNFHTGFNLVALHEWLALTGEDEWTAPLQSAYGYFIETFWLPDGCPKYYSHALYPIDIHCSAQGIITCLKLQELDGRSRDLANRIAQWAIAHMQSPQGYFHYQRTSAFCNRIPYIRWSQAWMFYALALLTTTAAAEGG